MLVCRHLQGGQGGDVVGLLQQALLMQQLQQQQSQASQQQQLLQALQLQHLLTNPQQDLSGAQACAELD